MGTFDFSLFIKKIASSIQPIEAPTEEIFVDRVQEYIQQNYTNSDYTSADEPDVSIDNIQQSVSLNKQQVINMLKTKPSFGLDNSDKVHSAEQTAQANNAVAAQNYTSVQQTVRQNNAVANQQTTNTEVNAERNNDEAVEQLDAEEQTAQVNNETASDKVNDAETSLLDKEQTVTDAEIELSNAQASLTSAQAALDSAATDEAKQSVKTQIEAAQKVVSEAEQKLEAAKRERDAAKQTLEEAKCDAEQVKLQGEEAVSTAENNTEQVKIQGEAAVKSAQENADEIKKQGEAAVDDAARNQKKVEQEGEEGVQGALNLSANDLFEILDSNGDKRIDGNDYQKTPSSFNYMLEDLGITKDSEPLRKNNFRNLINNSGRTTDEVISAAEQRYHDTYKEEIARSDIVAKNYEYSKEHISEISAKPRISNDYYQGEHSYSREFQENSIVITNTDTNEQITLDLTNLLAPFSEEDRAKIKETLKQLPAEALLDLNSEVTFNNNGVFNGSDGFYSSIIDQISVKGGTLSAETIVHELGHAIDARYHPEGINMNYYITGDPTSNFSAIFNEEMTAYNEHYTQATQTWEQIGDDKTVTTNTTLSRTGSNYATVSEQEMFAECYTLCMLGHCQSMTDIDLHFPKCLAAVKDMLAQTRQLPAEQRHRVN